MVKRANLWDFVGAICVIFLAGLLTQVASNIIRHDHSAPDVWTILGALATAAATIVALWVALKSDRDKARDEAIRARIVAAHVAPTLLQSVAKLGVIVQLTESMDREVNGAAQRLMRVDQIYGQLAAMRPTIDDLRALVPLESDCADRLAAGFAQIDLMHKMIVDDLAVFRQGTAAVLMATKMFSTYCGMTKGIIQTLEPALHVCNNASKIKIGGPGVKASAK